MDTCCPRGARYTLSLLPVLGIHNIALTGGRSGYQGEFQTPPSLRWVTLLMETVNVLAPMANYPAQFSHGTGCLVVS